MAFQSQPDNKGTREPNPACPRSGRQRTLSFSSAYVLYLLVPPVACLLIWWLITWIRRW